MKLLSERVLLRFMLRLRSGGYYSLPTCRLCEYPVCVGPCGCIAGAGRGARELSTPLRAALLAAILRPKEHYNEDPHTLVFSCRLCHHAWITAAAENHDPRCPIGRVTEGVRT